MAHLVTGYAGYEHITSADQRAFNASFFGDGQSVMEFGNQFAASIIDNNTVRILDGEGLMFGGHFRIETFEDVTIETGTAGKNRIDLICATYQKNATDGTEKVHLEVIKGTAASSPKVPSYTTGNLLAGATLNQMPLYKVTIEGVVLKKVEPLFITIPTYKALAERYAAEFQQSCTTHLNSLTVLNTMEEVSANKQENQLAGALAVKELANSTMSTAGGAFIGLIEVPEQVRVMADANNYIVLRTSTDKTGYALTMVGDGGQWQDIFKINRDGTFASSLLMPKANFNFDASTGTLNITL